MNMIFYIIKMFKYKISLSFELLIQLKSRTRYYQIVTVWGDNEEVATSETDWFETAKIDEAWSSKWITPNLDSEIHPILTKDFNIEKHLKVIKSARVYYAFK